MKARADSLRIAVGQMTAVDDVSVNCRQMLELIDRIEDVNLVDLIVFPENALYFRLDKNVAMPGLTLQDPSFQELTKAAVHHQVPILVGSGPMREPSGRVSNASVLIHANGSAEIVYRKIHLFDVDVVGQAPVRESDVFVHGNDPKILEIKGWRIGLSICYDLRFAELYSHYGREDVDVILVPSAFLVPTGQAHWHVLLRARAIENQAYVLAPAQAGEHVGITGHKRRTFGHSLAVDPWGEVMFDLNGAGPEVRVAILEQARRQWVKSQIPQQKHRRLSRP